jgi:hypothetical protein
MMFFGNASGSLSTKELENWLSQAFVPIEPSEVFIRKLRARLVRYHGKRPFSGWVVVGTIAMALMLLLTWFGLALRVILLIVSLLGVRDRRKRKGSDGSMGVPSAIEI